jgi:hypothetical protein
METTTIVLHGIHINLRYEWHSPDQIEWCLDLDSDVMVDLKLMLLETLLRLHYNETITKYLWDEHQARVYEEDARAAARAEDFNPF